jgi:hypothetical protein
MKIILVASHLAAQARARGKVTDGIDAVKPCRARRPRTDRVAHP